MSSEFQVDPALVSEVRKYGKFDVRACYACGSCTVICPSSSDFASFPRRCMRYVQVGLKEPLLNSLEPWLCYYCGDCSKSCPRETEPGESMMTLRRYLIAKYDWTGLSSKFYKSKVWETGALFLIGLFVFFLVKIFHGPIVTDCVALNTAFLPAELVHRFDLILFFTLLFFIFTNVFRMWWFTIIKSKIKIPISLYLTQIPTLILHAVTQIKFRDCVNKMRWLKHWLLTSGYVLMLILVVGLPFFFLTDNIYPIYHPQRWLGYYATVVLLIFSVEILVGRIKKQEEIHKFSHLSDWLFPVLLLLTTVSGIAVHIFRYSGLSLASYYTYTLHLMIAVSMLVIEVPFGKWAHLYYRPLAIYFHTIKERALQMNVKER